MLALDDPRWGELRGAFHSVWDPRPLVARLEAGEAAWEELWDELHHQGDVDTASYAVVPYLVRIYAERGIADWNLYALAGTIEVERHRGNPPLPPWLRDGYEEAWRRIVELGLAELRTSDDRKFTLSVLACLLIDRGLRLHGRMLLFFDDEEIEGVMEAYA